MNKNKLVSVVGKFARGTAYADHDFNSYTISELENMLEKFSDHYPLLVKSMEVQAVHLAAYQAADDIDPRKVDARWAMDQIVDERDNPEKVEEILFYLQANKESSTSIRLWIDFTSYTGDEHDKCYRWMGMIARRFQRRGWKAKFNRDHLHVWR